MDSNIEKKSLIVHEEVPNEGNNSRNELHFPGDITSGEPENIDCNSCVPKPDYGEIIPSEDNKQQPTDITQGRESQQDRPYVENGSQNGSQSMEETTSSEHLDSVPDTDVNGISRPKGRVKPGVGDGSKQELRSNNQENCLGLKSFIDKILSPFRVALRDSPLLWIWYVSIMFCIYFLFLYTTEREGNNHNLYADVVLIVSMGFGFVPQTIYLRFKSNEKVVKFERLPRDHSNAYLMAGVYVFGMGTLFTILLRLAIYVHAEEEVVRCIFHNVSQFPVVDMLKAGIQNGTIRNSTKFKPLVFFGGFCEIDIAFDVVRLLFTVVQLFFIQTFRSATFKKSIFVRFTLYHTLLTNGCIWIRYTVDETHLFEHAEYRSSIDRFVTSAFEMEEIMTPFILEYSLVAAGLLYNISAQMKDFDTTEAANRSTSSPNGNTTQAIKKDDDRIKDAPHTSTSSGDGGNPQEMDGSNRAAGDAYTSPCDAGNPQTKEIHYRTTDTAHGFASAVHSNSNQEMTLHTLNIEAAREQSIESTNKLAPSSQPGLILGAIGGLLLPVLSLTFGTGDNKFIRISHIVFLSHEGILAFVQSIFVYWILKLLMEHRKSNTHELRSEDTLLLAGYLGTFVFHFITFYSVIMALKDGIGDKLTNILTIAHLLFLMISHLLQTILVIISSRYSCERGNIKSAKKIQQLSLFFLTTNLGFWALDSFFEMKNNASSSYPTGKTVLQNEWNIITALTYPFTVFYRFHSAQMFYELWSRFKIKE